MAQQSKLSEALALEKTRFMTFVGDAAKEARAEIAALHAQTAARGTCLSGGRLKAEMKIRFDKIQGIVEKQIALRREVGSRVPELFEDQHLKALKSELDRHVDSAAKGIADSVCSAAPELGGAVNGALRGHAEREAGSIKARLNSELHALGLESRLGFHEEAAPVASFNISNSTIANLNLGTVVGDLNASVQNLTGQGEAELATATGRLAEEITTSRELQDAQRKEFLEHLSLVSGEAARPTQERRMGLLRSSITFLRTGPDALGRPLQSR